MQSRTRMMRHAGWLIIGLLLASGCGDDGVLAPTGTTTTVGPGATCAVSPFGGTSNATPIAMGCMMLWKSANPSLTPEDVAPLLARMHAALANE